MPRRKRRNAAWSALLVMLRHNSSGCLSECDIWRREQGGAWEHWFTVKQSLIGAFAGDGLFAARDFKHGTVLGVYDGPNVGVPETPAGEAAAAKLIADKAGADDSRGRYVFWLGEGESYPKACRCGQQTVLPVKRQGGD